MDSSRGKITQAHLLFISFAAIFGSGWLFAPFYAAQIAGPASLIAWVLGAIMSCIIGITMAEVVVLYPKSGGLAFVSRRTHGTFLSLSITLLNLLVFIILPAIEVRAILQYLATHFQIMMAGKDAVSPWGYLFAFFLLSLITLTNLYGARVTATLTRVLVLFKIVTPVVLCGSFLSVLYSNHSLDHSRLVVARASWAELPWSAIFQAIATSGIIFSFNGFNQATIFAGEAKNPKKAIPFAILGSLTFSGALYVLIQYVFLMAVPKESIANGWENLSFSGDAGPFAGIASVLGLGWITVLIYADAVISPLGTAFSYASAAPRLFDALFETSRKKSALNFKVNQYGIAPSFIGLTLILECAVFVLLPSLKAMISLLVAAFVLCYTVAPASLLALRKSQPNLNRPFRVRMAPFVSFLSLFFSNLMVFSCGWVALRNLLCLLLAFVVLYQGACFALSGKSKALPTIRGSEWFLFQLLSTSAVCWYGQKFALSFSVTTLALGSLSLIALVLSQIRTAHLSDISPDVLPPQGNLLVDPQ